MKIENVTLTDFISETSTDYTIITETDGSFVSMPKSVYDEQQKALKESLVVDEPATKSK